MIRDLAVELSRLAVARERLADEIEAVFTRHPQAAVLLSLPGVGARTGTRILTEIGDVTRFLTSGHLAAYAGLAPVTKQSGRSIKANTDPDATTASRTRSSDHIGRCLTRS